MLVVLTGISLYTKAQGKAVILDADTVVVAPPDSTVQAVLQSADSASRVKGKEIDLKPFKPNPTKAVILSAILPGLGQIYNKAYWKLPIVYGGFMGCIYAITWNNKNYKDYSTAYFDLMYDVKNNADDPSKWSSSWTDIAKKNGYDPEKFMDRVSGNKYSIEMVLQSIRKFVPVEDFLDMVIFDYLIGNTDRHQNNWAIVEENGKMTWSPLYDNSSSFFDLKIFTQ